MTESMIYRNNRTNPRSDSQEFRRTQPKQILQVLPVDKTLGKPLGSGACGRTPARCLPLGTGAKAASASSAV